MRKTDAERRAFLKSLKPRLVAIGEAAARSGPIDEETLLDDIDKAREEYHLLEHERAAVAH